MAESWRTFFTRHVFNWWPCYRGTGARLTYIAADWREIHVAIPLSWRTRNYVGTIFGGAMTGGTDPLFMLMLIHCLGKDYTVWDKAVSIRFRRPGKQRLRAVFRVDEAELETIRRLAAEAPSIDRVYAVELVDSAGEVCATVERTVYIRWNNPVANAEA